MSGGRERKLVLVDIGILIAIHNLFFHLVEVTEEFISQDAFVDSEHGLIYTWIFQLIYKNLCLLASCLDETGYMCHSWKIQV